MKQLTNEYVVSRGSNFFSKLLVCRKTETWTTKQPKDSVPGKVSHHQSHKINQLRKL